MREIEERFLTLDDPVDVLVVRERCLSDFVFFTRYFYRVVYGRDYIVAPHHLKLAHALMLVFRQKIFRLTIHEPPQFGKTHLCVVAFIAFCFAHYSRCRFVHTSYSDKKVRDNSRDIISILSTSQFCKLFGNILPDKKVAKDIWRTSTGGGLLASPHKGQITGFSAGVMGLLERFTGAVILDDPIKPGDVDSYVRRTECNETFVHTVSNRVAHGERTPIIVIHHRLHPDDLIGFLHTGGTGEKWYHLNLAARYVDDAGAPHSSWPYKYSLARLAQIERANPYYFSSQFQGDTRLPEGTLIKDAHLRRYDSLPAFAYLEIFVDTASKIDKKATDDHDYTVMQLWGRTEGGIYLVDQFREKLEFPKLQAAVEAFYRANKNKYGAVLRYVRIEDKSSGIGLIQSLLRLTDAPVVPLAATTSKEVKARNLLGFFEAACVNIPGDADRYPWVTDYVLELLRFPKAKHDDQVDCTLYAIEEMLSKDSGLQLYGVC